MSRFSKSIIVLGMLVAIASTAKDAAAQLRNVQHKVLSVTSNVSANEAAANMTLKIGDWVTNGWTPVNITSADMFAFQIKDAQTLTTTTEWDVYVLLSCTPAPPARPCKRLTPP
jgi:hypothetical protein